MSRDLWHSRGNYRLDHHFKNRTPVVRQLFNRCLGRVESFGPPGHGIHFRLTTASDLDRDLKVLMREAYAENAPARNRNRRVHHARMHPPAAGVDAVRPRAMRPR